MTDLSELAATIQDGIDADTGDYTSQEEAEEALRELLSSWHVLEEFFEAHWLVEQGIVDFDLHAPAVERLQIAQLRAYNLLHNSDRGNE